MLAALRNRSFFLIFLGQTVSKVGNGMYRVALAWTVYGVTRSALDMGTVLAVNAIPQVLLVLFGGVLSDRLSRRAVILSSDLVSAFITLGLTVQAASGHLTFASILIASAVLGLAGSLYSPAYSAVVSDVVPKEQYVAANGVMNAGANLAQITGPALAGLVYGAGGATAVFGLNSASFVVAVLTMACTAAPERTVRYRGTIWAGVREGLSYSFGTRWLRYGIGLSVAVNTVCAAPFLVLLPLLIRRAGGGSGMLGLAFAADFGATALTSLAIARRPAIRKAGLKLCLLCGCLGLGTLVAGAISSLPLILVGAVLVGVGFGFNVVESTMIQSEVPPDILSRVFSVDIILSFVALPAAYVLAGSLQQSVGARAVLVTGGTAIAACSLLAARTRAMRTFGEEERHVASGRPDGSRQLAESSPPAE